jgi:hypothetical protein
MSHPDPQSTKWSEKAKLPLFVALGLAVLTLAVFQPALDCDFVNYDDPDYVTGNETVQRGLTWGGFIR